jgi:hypothetical protein
VKVKPPVENDPIEGLLRTALLAASSKVMVLALAEKLVKAVMRPTAVINLLNGLIIIPISFINVN